MQIIIDIPEDVRNRAAFGITYRQDLQIIGEAIANGTPLPAGHGDLIDASKINFENADFDTYADYCRAFDAIDQAEIIIPADKEGDE